LGLDHKAWASEQLAITFNDRYLHNLQGDVFLFLRRDPDDTTDDVGHGMAAIRDLLDRLDLEFFRVTLAAYDTSC
jgi:hypothetical protein